MMDRDQVLAIVSKLKNTRRSVVVDLESVSDRVVEVDACGRVQDHIDLFGQLLADSGVQT